MSTQPVTPPADAHRALPHADFADAYATILRAPDGVTSGLEATALDAHALATRALSDMPPWIGFLLRLRNIVVKPLGLKAAPDPRLPRDAQIGFFPLVSSRPGQVVLGLDDRHLDFRIVIDVEPIANDQRRVTATTLVKRNSALGYAYLAAVMPFHKRIVPILLARVATPAKV